MKHMTKMAILLISLFLVSCITNSNYNDELNDNLDNRIKIYDAIYDKLNEVFGEDPAIVGVITAIETEDEIFRILVEEDPDVNSPTEPGGKKIWLTINKETEVFIEVENNFIQVEEFKVELGQIAGGWFIDVAHSYPSQAIAQRIVFANT